MYIKELELENFKSFKGKTTIKFSKGLNVIFGPNGSGKSNIIDAILFVLGEGSRSELRAETFSDIPYKGEGVKFAKVSIKIDNSDKKLKNLPEEVVITRVVTKDGKGGYRINGERASREAVINILSELRLESKINIIGQGKITEIIEIKEEELANMIKSISGISAFDTKKEKAESELNKALENISKIELIKKEKLNQMKELEEESKKAQQYENDRKLLREIEYKILKIKKIEMQEVYDKIKSSVEEIKKKEEEVQKEYDELEGTIKEVSDELSKLENERKEKGGENYDRIQNRLKQLEEDLIRINVELENKQNQLKENEISLNNIIKDIEDSHKRLEDGLNRQKELQEQIKALSEKRDAIVKKAKEVAETIAKKESIEREINKINEEIIHLQNLLSEHNEIIENVKQYEKLESEKKAIQEELSKLKEEEKSLTASIDELNKKLLMIEEKLRGNEDKLDNAVKLLKGIPGVIDSVYNLISINQEELMLPILRAGGSRLNLIVVENEDVANEAIKFLKENKLGFASFIPLTRVLDRRTIPVPTREGVIGRASDFVSYNPELKNVIEFVLGDTLIVKDFSTAKELKGYRCVTLEGTLFEPSGIITGGASKEIDSKIDEMKKKEIIKSLLKEKEDAEKDIAAKKEQLILISAKIKELNEKIRSIEDQLSKLGEYKQKYADLSKVNELSNLIKRKEELSKELQTIKVEGNKDVYISEVSYLDRELASQSAKLEEITNNVNSVLLPYVKELNNRKEKIIENIDYLKSEIERLKQQKEIEEKEIEGRKEEVGKLSEEIKEVDKRIDELSNKREELIKNLAKLNKELASVRNDREKQEKSLVEVETKLSLIMQELKKYEDLGELDVKEDIDTLVKLEKEIKERLESYGKINELALDQYNKLKIEVDEIEKDLQKLYKEKEDIERVIKEIEEKRIAAFMSSLSELNKTFNYLVQVLINGRGEVAPKDEGNIVEGGLIIKVSVPHKNISSIRMLSGGEKSLVSFALSLSMSKLINAPFLIFDEIDAALDGINVVKLASYIKALSNQIQVIMISHNDITPKYADLIIGVAMNEGVSSAKIISADMFKASSS